MRCRPRSSISSGGAAGRHRGPAFLLALALIAPVGCGGDDAGSAAEQRRLSAAEQSIVARSQTALHSYCRKIGLYLTRRQPLPSSSETQQVNSELDRLVALARDKPEAEFQSRGTLRELLGAMVEDLEGANCSGGFEAKLERALAMLPQQ